MFCCSLNTIHSYNFDSKLAYVTHGFYLQSLHLVEKKISLFLTMLFDERRLYCQMIFLSEPLTLLYFFFLRMDTTETVCCQDRILTTRPPRCTGTTRRKCTLVFNEKHQCSGSLGDPSASSTIRSGYN